ncbi:MAG: hypothetical protein JJT82_05655 [Legionellaceae bacterium]|nr:hypothetical protein [Legionellaceae bacterium]
MKKISIMCYYAPSRLSFKECVMSIVYQSLLFLIAKNKFCLQLGQASNLPGLIDRCRLISREEAQKLKNALAYNAPMMDKKSELNELCQKAGISAYLEEAVDQLMTLENFIQCLKIYYRDQSVHTLDMLWQLRHYIPRSMPEAWVQSLSTPGDVLASYLEVISEDRARGNIQSLMALLNIKVEQLNLQKNGKLLHQLITRKLVTNDELKQVFNACQDPIPPAYLFSAVMSANEDLLKFLVEEKGLDVNYRGQDSDRCIVDIIEGNNILDMVFSDRNNRSPHIVSYLVGQGAEISNAHGKKLTRLITSSDEAKKMLLQHKEIKKRFSLAAHWGVDNVIWFPMVPGFAIPIALFLLTIFLLNPSMLALDIGLLILTVVGISNFVAAPTIILLIGTGILTAITGLIVGTLALSVYAPTALFALTVTAGAVAAVSLIAWGVLCALEHISYERFQQFFGFGNTDAIPSSEAESALLPSQSCMTSLTESNDANPGSPAENLSNESTMPTLTPQTGDKTASFFKSVKEEMLHTTTEPVPDSPPNP